VEKAKNLLRQNIMAFIAVDDSSEFKETVSRLCSIEHFYMLMNNSGLFVF